MKANELMSGDWVQLDEGCARVISIALDGIYFEDSKGEGVASLDRISPIPITPEILEKNGFNVGMYSILTLDENRRLEYYHHEGRLELIYEGIDEWENHSRVHDVSFRCNCTYVHELQHALRLCGIDKEIEL